MKKYCAVLFILTLFSFASFALPGVMEYIPTQAGEYVYYRDYTFEEETYIGFLQYDSGTYAVRFYSPDSKISSPDIHILLTMDPDSQSVALTGEKIISDVTAYDVDIVNYLHDLIYEFNARRKKVNDKDFSSSIRISEVFEQFGGTVTMVYDGYIPLYSLESIRSEKGDILFQAVTMGVILDTDDTSFESFKGFPSLPSLTSTNDLKENLDDSWNKDGETYWTMGDNALFFINALEVAAEDYKNYEYTPEDFFTRYFLLSTAGSYFYLPFTTVENQGGAEESSLLLVNMALSFSGDATYTKDFKVLVKDTDSKYWFYVLSVYDSFYKENKSYFDTFIRKLIP